MTGLLWFALAAILLFACATDCKSCEVYNFTWWIGGAAALLLLAEGRGNILAVNIAQLLFYIALQLLFFSRMYGKADCYAFSVCAVAEMAVGMQLMEYLFHMLIAFVFLAIVQGVKHNIADNGNLKHPVPFLPYITLAFWTLLWYHVNVRT